MVPMRVQKLEVRPTHEPTPLVAADVRRLTLPQRVLREKDRASLPRLLREIGLGSWVQFTSENRRSLLPMNLTFGNSKLLAFSPLTPALSPLRGEGAVHGPNARPKVGGPSYP